MPPYPNLGQVKSLPQRQSTTKTNQRLKSPLSKIPVEAVEAVEAAAVVKEDAVELETLVKVRPKVKVKTKAALKDVGNVTQTTHLTLPVLSIIGGERMHIFAKIAKLALGRTYWVSETSNETVASLTVRTLVIWSTL